MLVLTVPDDEGLVEVADISHNHPELNSIAATEYGLPSHLNEDGKDHRISCKPKKIHHDNLSQLQSTSLFSENRRSIRPIRGMKFHGLSVSSGLGPRQEEPVSAHGAIHPGGPSRPRPGDWTSGMKRRQRAKYVAPGNGSANNGTGNDGLLAYCHSSIVP